MTDTKTTAAKATKETQVKDGGPTEADAPTATFEAPVAMRGLAEAGMGQVKNAYESYRALAEDATGAIEDSFASVNQGLSALQAKALDIGRKNVDASFDFAAKLLTAKSVAEAIELQTRFARQQFNALSEQAREFQDLATKIQADAAKPFQEGLSKAAAQFHRAN